MNRVKNDMKRRIYDWILKLIRLVDQLPKDTSSQIIAKQLMRSGTSIGANYIEAQAAASRKDFANFISYSLKSANESKFWIALLRDTNKTNLTVLTPLLQELVEIANILGASLLTLKGRRKI